MNTPEKTKRDIFPFTVLFLFGSVFFCAGCAITFSQAIKPLVILDRARAWTETPAEILHLELKRSDSTYRIDMRYQYEFNGQAYTSERFAAVDASDNFSSFHHKNYRHYKPFFESKQPISCWVDHNNPAEAIINRTIRFEWLAFVHLFVFIFPIIGLFVMLAAFLTLRAKPEPDRNTRQIPVNTTPLYIFALPAALVLTYTVFLFSKLIHFTPWPWHTWLLLLPALILVPLFIYRYIHNKAFNGTCLDLSRTPAIGDTLSGTVLIPFAADNGPLTVTLRCQRYITSGGGTKSSNITTLWKTETTITTISDGTTTTLPVRIALPPGQPPTTAPDATLPVTWQLCVKVKRSGLRHTLTFDLPVQPGNPAATAEADTPIPLPHPGDFSALDPLLKLKRVTLTRHAPHDFEIAFNASQALPKVFSALCFLTFAGAFIFYGVQMVKNQEHTTSSKFFFDNFMWIGFVFIAVLSTLATLLAISRGIRCDTLNRTFTVWWQIGTFPRKERVIAFEYVASFGTEVAVSTNDVPTHYTVHLQTLGGDKHTFTKMIKGDQPTQALTRFLNAQPKRTSDA